MKIKKIERAILILNHDLLLLWTSSLTEYSLVFPKPGHSHGAIVTNRELNRKSRRSS